MNGGVYYFISVSQIFCQSVIKNNYIMIKKNLITITAIKGTDKILFYNCFRLNNKRCFIRIIQ